MKTVTTNRQLMKALRKINRGFECSCEVLLFMDKGKVLIDRARAVYREDEEAEDVPVVEAELIHRANRPEWRRAFL